MFKQKTIIISIILILTGITAYPGEEVINSYLKTHQLVKGAVMKIEDPKIYSGGTYNSGWQSDFSIKQTRNAIQLFVNTEAADFGSKNFTCEVDLKLTYKDAKNKVVQNARGKDTTRVNLGIGYEKQGDYQKRDLYRFDNAHQIYLEVIDVTINGADTASLTNVVLLKSSIASERYYDMKNTNVNGLTHTYFNKDNELEISWKDKEGAVAYDLEWTWVDNYDYSQGGISRVPRSQARFDFDKNSQRIRIEDNKYRLPVVYEEGYLVYRVRPLAKGGNNFTKVKYGPWSEGSGGTVSSAGSNAFTISSNLAHEKDKMNWQYEASFSEKAKKSAKVTYYDGLNYTRQKVQQMQSGDNVMVGETKYDYHGREAVKILSTPVASKKTNPALKHYDAFNKDRQGNPYSKDDFDKVANCKPAAAPMSKSSGAAKYYSSNNALQSIFKDYLPKAKGYPFSQKKFLPDKSYRERKIGKVGKQYQLGKGNEIQQFFGTPSQSELDRLFGSDVGYARNYHKKVVANENGQLEVSYLDEKNNIIANALAGESPKSLEKLPADQRKSHTITADILSNRQRHNTSSVGATKKIAVTTKGSKYSFKYTLNPSTYSRYVCEGEQICYDGIYNLVIRLTNECGDVIKDTTMQVGSVQNIDEKCNDNQSVTLSFSSGPLSVGSYLLSKKLVINEQALQKYLDMFEQKSCIQSKWDTIYKENRKKMDTVSCNQGCGDGAPIKDSYSYTTEDGKTHTVELSEADKKRMKEERSSLCGAGANTCETSYDVLLGDVSPNGQYGLYYDTTKDEVAPGKFPLSVMNHKNNKLPSKDASWRNPDPQYENRDGSTSYVNIEHIGGRSEVLKPDNHILVRDGDSVVKPQHILKLETFVGEWKDSWAKSLVKYHPEYGYYLYCRQHPASNDFDSYLLGTGKYTNAVDSGYVSANGNTKLLSKDPFFSNNPQLKSKMQNRLQHFDTIQGQSFSLKDIVAGMHNDCFTVKCATNSVDLNKLNNCISQAKPLFKNKDNVTRRKEWSSYRSIYLSLKREIIAPERHKFAINRGYYNKCIGVKNSGNILGYSTFKNKYPNASSSFNKSRSCFSCLDCYSEKDMRFPGEDDIYKYVKGLDKVSDTVEVEEMENYVDNKMKRKCDKCPVETDLEALLNGMVQEGSITGNQNATNEVASCGLKNQMNAGNKDYFSWQASVSGRELTGKLMAGQVHVSTIRLYDSTKRQINWDNIVLFTCLQHTTTTNHYTNTQTRNFKVRAISESNEVFWLEGMISNVDLTECDIEKFCTKNSIAGELKNVFNTVFGYGPMIRELYVNNSNRQYFDSLMPQYRNTKLIGELTLNTLSQQLKDQHKRPGSFQYHWIVDTLLSNGQKMRAGIYEPKKITDCPFEFEMLDDSKQFGQPFIVNKVLLNHPAIEQTNCDATAFVLQVTALEFNQNQNFISSMPGTDRQLPVSPGETFYIKVTNECYSAGECCPESNCPDIVQNGGFGQGTSGFSSDLPYDKEEQKDNFYRIYPSSANTGGLINDLPLDELQNLNRMNINPGLFNTGDTTDQDGSGINNFNNLNTGGLNNNFTGINDTTGDGAVPNPKFIPGGNLTGIPDFEGDSNMQYQFIMQQMQQYNNLFRVMDNLMQNQQETSESIIDNMRTGGQDNTSGEGFYWQQERMPVWNTFPGFETQTGDSTITTQDLQQIRGRLVKGNINYFQNKYLVFKVSDLTKRQVWKQSPGLKKDRTYSLRVKVKPLVDNIPRSGDQFSVSVGNQEKTLGFKEMEGKWKVLTAYFTVGNVSTSRVSLQFKAESHNPNVGYQKWAVDDIVVKPQSCKQAECCPPIMPDVPDNTVENPCKQQKEVIAKANTDREFEEFLNDTLSGIEAGYRKAVMDVNESFTMTYTDNFYDYTLYYYNQAGNLIKTIPPKGFNPLAQSKVDKVQQNRNNNNNNPVRPNHKMATKYTYNSHNQVVEEDSPDKGVTKFWYNVMGKVVAKQDSEQRSRGNVYTYYFYDSFEREIEAGEVQAKRQLTEATALFKKQFEHWVKRGERSDVSNIYYDEPINSGVNSLFPNGQDNLRKNVASVTFEADYDNDPQTYDFATHYSYSTQGVVKFIVQENTNFPQPHQVKKISYDYDLVTGKIEKVTYQPNQKDQFLQKYQYDEDRRLKKVLTSRYGYIWDEDVKMYYYPHGPLARVEYGEEKVQGIDHAYTLQGWSKGMNASSLSPSDDIGKDGAPNSIFSNVARDAVSLVFDYNRGDYASIDGTNHFTSHLNQGLGNTSPDLYNSNIRQMVVHNAAFENKTGLAQAYTYDQLGRLVKSDVHVKKQGNWQNVQGYQTNYSYDANGNMTTLSRKGEKNLMDDLTLHYKSGNNQLKYVSDNVSKGAFPNDIDDQNSNNYVYDEKGRLIRDRSAGLQGVNWSRRDLMKHVVKQNGNTIYYDYNGGGERVMKTINAQNDDEDKVIYYVRGADDNILATYEYRIGEDSTYVSEFYIRGDKRLGVYNLDTTLNSMKDNYVRQYRGKKQYPIKNHIDNVLATVSDRKIPDTTAQSKAKYRPDIVSATGYYPYGSQMPGRKKQTDKYKFGFQGKENDNELKGEGNSYYFKERMYDSRLGRWLSVDPEAKKSPNESVYLGMGANPVNRIDPDGAEDKQKIKQSIDYGNILWAELAPNVLQAPGVLANNLNSESVYGFNSALNQMRDVSRQWTNISGAMAGKSVNTWLKEHNIASDLVDKRQVPEKHYLSYDQTNPGRVLKGIKEMKQKRRQLKALKKQAGALNNLAWVELVRDKMDITSAAENYVTTEALDATVFMQAKRNFGYVQKNVDAALGNLNKAIDRAKGTYLRGAIKKLKQKKKQLDESSSFKERMAVNVALEQYQEKLEKWEKKHGDKDWKGKKKAWRDREDWLKQ